MENATDTTVTKALVIGAYGQIGSELTAALREKHGTENVVAADLRLPADNGQGPSVALDVMDYDRLCSVISANEITQVYHLAAMLSARGEQNPELAWDLNMKGLLNVLNAAKELKLDKVFWPSSIAVFGTESPSVDTPQVAPMNPTTVYGISKRAGELWCEYYSRNFGVDVRSLRFPGLIGYKSLPGGGTTDYAVDIYHKAVEGRPFTCFLDRETRLPMMYMPDAIRATVELMEAPAERVKVRTSYNLQGLSFTPEEVAAAIRKREPGFSIGYAPDYRQAIAASWPDSIDDAAARNDWEWKPDFDLDKMTLDMLVNLGEAREKSVA